MQFSDPVLNRLVRQAEAYIVADSNASMIKQGMMLERACRQCLIRAGLLTHIIPRNRTATLDEMLNHLITINFITKGKDSSYLCYAVKRNRNDAVHDFLDSKDNAMRTFKPLVKLCALLLEKSGAKQQKPAIGDVVSSADGNYTGESQEAAHLRQVLDSFTLTKVERTALSSLISDEDWA